jgi:hypothetical protein
MNPDSRRLPAKAKDYSYIFLSLPLKLLLENHLKLEKHSSENQIIHVVK